MTFSLAQLVINNEIIGMVERVISGISVDDELMGVDLIKKIGIGGNFLSERHSLDHIATEQAQSTIIDRRMRGAWEKKGSKGMLQNANEKVKEILKTHKPMPLPEGAAEEFERIIESAEE